MQLCSIINLPMAEKIQFGPPTNIHHGSCFIDVALVALLHHPDPAIFHLLKPVTKDTPPIQKQLRSDLVVFYNALQTGIKPAGQGGWIFPRARIRAILAKRHFDPKEFMTEQQDARAAVSMLLESLEATEPHVYDETNRKGDVTGRTKTIYRETLLAARDARTSLPHTIMIGDIGTIMRDIVTDGKERHVLRSLGESPICWFFGIRRVSDIVDNTEVLTKDRNIKLPNKIKILTKSDTAKHINLVSIVLRTLGTIHGGHYTCLILRDDAWWLYDGMDSTSTDTGTLTKITTTTEQSFDELLTYYAIVGAYYQE